MSLAAENGTHRVVSGPAALVDALVSGWEAAGVRCQRLSVSHAFHSGLLEPVLDAFEAAAGEIAYAAPRISLVSNLTGGVFAAGTGPDAGYWRRHARGAVRFGEGVAALAGLGMDVLVEMGPRPVLVSLARGCWPEESEAPVAVASLRPGLADERVLAEAAAGLYAAGVDIDLAAREAGLGRRRIALPGYPFEPVRHWIEAGPDQRAGGQSAGGRRPAGHALLGERHRSARGETSWTQELSAGEPGWTVDHQVFGSVVAPGALHACLAAAAAGVLPVAVADGQIHPPLVLTDAPVALQLLLAEGQDGVTRGWQVFARDAEDAEGEDVGRDGAEGDDGGRAWRLHASGTLANAGAGAPALPAAAGPLAERDVAAFYARLAELGIGYGPGFRGIVRLWAARARRAARSRRPKASPCPKARSRARNRRTCTRRCSTRACRC